MVCNTPFLVATGLLPERAMSLACNALSKAWGGDLFSVSYKENPDLFLNSLSCNDGLIQLIGDAAIFDLKHGTWLEALGSWRQPTIFMAQPLSSGEMPGVAGAYVCLAKKLSVPLLGIVQVGGHWNESLRRCDGLPWCGYIPLQEKTNFSGSDLRSNSLDLRVEEVASCLRNRKNFLIA